MFTSFDKLPQEKKENILNTCIDVFLQYGYTLANTIDMAKLCGIAKGSLFHYFGSKKDLFLYLVRLCIDRVMAETQNGLAAIQGSSYLIRLRESVKVKMALPAQYPRETAFLSKAFAERGHEAAEELRTMAIAYAIEMKKLNNQYIGDIEPDMLHEGIVPEDARSFIQTVFDGITTRLLKQYAANPQALLEHPELLSNELETAINFILNGIGKRS